MNLRTRFLCIASVLLLCQQTPSWGQLNPDEMDEGGIGGTGMSDSKRRRPEIIERPDVPERIERIDVPERPEIDTPERPESNGAEDVITPSDGRPDGAN